MLDSYLPFDIITWEDVTGGELLRDNEAEGLISETLSLVFGFFGVTLFTLEAEERFNIGRVSFIPKIIEGKISVNTLV